MRYSTLVAAALLAVPAAASAANSAWGFFEANGGAGVGVQSAEGVQLMLKCDKPGANSVYAVVARKASFVPPAQAPVMRDVRIRLDANPPYDDHWRFFENTAMAVNKGNERSLSHLLGGLGQAKAVELLLYYDPKTRVPLNARFDVSGADEAISQVYSTCKDTVPKA